MTTGKSALTFAVVAVLVTAGIVASAAARQGDVTQQTGPVYTLEGAWYGRSRSTAWDPRRQRYAASNARPGEGTSLCTISVVRTMSNPVDPGWLEGTLGPVTGRESARKVHSMVRTIFDRWELFGWAKFCRARSPISEDKWNDRRAVPLADGTDVAANFMAPSTRDEFAITFDSRGRRRSVAHRRHASRPAFPAPILRPVPFSRRSSFSEAHLQWAVCAFLLRHHDCSCMATDRRPTGPRCAGADHQRLRRLRTGA
jgi:hypothetical protein